MKNKPKLNFYFSLIIFTIMFISAVIISLFSFFMIHFGIIHPGPGNIINFIFFILFMSVAIGTILSLFVGEKILKPLTEISKVSQDVAQGDFSVRINQKHRIPEIQALINNFNKMIEELNSIETLRSDFVVNVSHEFKTPIAAIEGYATLLLDETDDTEKNEYIHMIIDSANQLSSLTGNILLLSRLEKNNGILEKETYRLDESIREAILLLENKWTNKEIEFDLDLPYTLFYGNKAMCHQVWLNLIDNAIKFSYPQGIIHIYLKQDHEYNLFTIQDEGCGMDAHTLKHIFDKFYQGDTSRKMEGNGLGLALCKTIIERHDGQIIASSTLNKGTTITVKLKQPDH